MNLFANAKEFLISIVATLISFLPDSPFQFSAEAEFRQFFGYLNYFIPIGAMLNVFSAWLVCVASYYVSSLILRWVKAIE